MPDSLTCCSGSDYGFDFREFRILDLGDRRRGDQLLAGVGDDDVDDGQQLTTSH